ncbi:MAG: type IV secretion system DNA-binding domain-containing protein [Oscillospiraceae bacterium]|nr:type IV secretion system DNA-binding domain-containing protein [Oscillospiraceae bacterium]
MITYGFAYSLSDWLILLCFSAITALITADILNERVRQIKPLEEDMKDVEGANQNHTHKKGRDKHYMIPQNLTGKTIIGSSGNKPIATEDSARHIFCCGTTGSGKTVLLSNYIESGMKQNYPMMIIDGKGDIGKGSINEIVHHFAGKRKVYIIDMNQPENSDKYNPFQNTNPTICKDMIINMTDWTEVHYKSNTERYVQRVIQLMKLCGIPFSFANIVKYMDAERFMQISGQAVKNGMLTKEDHLETINICKASGEIARDASARFSTIMESELGTIFDESGIDIYGALRKNAVILFILNPLLYPEVSQLLGRLILIDAKKAVSNFFAQPIPRIFYIMDEINVYASPTLIDLINKSRSANITCIAATQSLADLEYSAGDAFKQQLIENCNNYIVMRQNSAKSAEEWANILGTRQAIEITHQLGNHQNISVPTGYGSAKRTRKYHYHPDEIKALMTGEAIYMSKDSMTHKRIKVRKGF